MPLHSIVFWKDFNWSTIYGDFIRSMYFTRNKSNNEVTLQDYPAKTHFLLPFTNRLLELRSNGIKTIQAGLIYHKLRTKRMARVRTKPNDNWEWKHLVPTGSINLPLSASDQILKHCQNLQQMPTKRKSTPLNIIGLPNFDQLDKDEKELCSRIRVVPDAYLMYKKMLVAENGKIGYLRLADARRLIKIDVNKTRVMYDFFVEHGFVSKPFDK